MTDESETSQHIPKARDGLSSIVATGLFLLGGVLVAVRFALAAVWQIGVPGVLPSDPGAIRPITSLLYHLSLTAPLAFTAVLAAHGPRRWGWTAALMLGSAYAGTGATIGYRSYPVLAFTTLAFSWLIVRSRHDRPKEVSRGSAFALAVGGVAALVSLRLALTNRALGRVGAADQGVIDFLSARIGGLDYLSPVVHAVDRYGASVELAFPGNWDLFMRVAVYGLPAGAVTGFAATLPGWLYGIGSIFVVVSGGFLAGWAAARADAWCRRARAGSRPAVGTALTVGAALSWLNLLAEGTLRASTLQAGGYVVAAVTVAALTGGTGRGFSPLRTEAKQRAPYGAAPRTSARGRTVGR